MWPSLAGNFSYGLSNTRMQLGVNVPGSAYFSQADFYFNYANSKGLRLGAGGLFGVLSGGYHLLGFPIGSRTEAGIGIEYLRGTFFGNEYPRDIYATWLQLWTENDSRSSIGVHLQYQVTGTSYQCAPAYNCPVDLSDQGSIAMRASYLVRIGR